MEELFEALGHADRLEIVDYLIEHGSATQAELQRALGFQKGTLSKWTTRLEEGGVIRRDAVGAPFELVSPDLVCALLERALEHQVEQGRLEIERLTTEIHDKRERAKRYAARARNSEELERRRTLRSIE